MAPAANRKKGPVGVRTGDGLEPGAWFVRAAGCASGALAAVHALEALGYPPDRTIYFGESLGAGVVAANQVIQRVATVGS